MAQTEKDHKILIYGADVREKLLKGAHIAYKAVTTTFGPKGRNVLIEKSYGRPVLTRDGVTVSKEVYSKDRAVNMGMQLVMEASSTTNRVAGDGTTGTVALTYHLMKKGFEQIVAGKDPMELRATIANDANKLLDELGKVGTPVKEGQLEQVATVSSGDPLLGKMIAQTVEKVGENGGIITEKAHISDVEREYVDGYYLQNGFTAITDGKKEIENPLVVVTAKPLTSPVDALEILTKLSQANPGVLRVAFFGEIEGDAYNTIVGNVMNGKIDAVIIGTPSIGDMGDQYLEDIAIYTGAKLLSKGDNIQSFDASFAGKADRVVCTNSSASLFSTNALEGTIENRVEQLKQRLETEESDVLAEKIRDRMAKLEGKIALFRIGGATETEKEEKEFRIEDAIQATRAAYSNGVVPGGGTTLLRLSQTEGISDVTKTALLNTFKRLVRNASLPADVKVKEVLDSKPPMGINLKKGGELVDLVKEGILDPTLVLEQIITNAASTAGNAITTDCLIVFEDKKDK